MIHLIQQEHYSPVSEGCAVLLWLSAKWTFKGRKCELYWSDKYQIWVGDITYNYNVTVLHAEENQPQQCTSVMLL